MPEKQTLKRARKAQSEGKRPTTVASEFVREEMHHMKEGKHGKESRAQAIAIGLSKARKAGVALPAPKAGAAKRKTRQSAAAAYRRGQEEGELSKKSPARRSSGAAKKKTATKRAGTAKRGSTSRGRSTAARKTSRGRA
jgi:hypothetical protein